MKFTKSELKELEVANGYKYYDQDEKFVYFQAKRGNLYASIKIKQSDVMDHDQRLFMMNKDLTH